MVALSKTLMFCFVFIVPFLEIPGNLAAPKCSIDVININALILHNNLTYIIPKFGKLALNQNEKIILGCPGPRNFITALSDTNCTTIKCVRNSVFKVNRTNFEFSEIKCKKKVSANIHKTSESCWNHNGQVLNIGYNIFDGINNLTFISICYDKNMVVPLYAQHYIYGAELKYASKNQARPGFSTEGLPNKGSHISVVYQKAFQKSTFNGLMDSAVFAENYINNRSLLQKGHLAPKADFLYEFWQNGSFFYLNTAPQWSSINNGNWKSLESEVRNISTTHSSPLRIVTGTYEVLSLPDRNNNQVPIYLDTKKKIFPVPKYFWKIVYDETSRTGIVFVALNNPFFPFDEKDRFCGRFNFCAEYKWGPTSWSDPSAGPIFCCPVPEFTANIPAPKLSANRVLRGPN